MIEALPTGKALVVQVVKLLVTTCALQPAIVVAPALKATLPVSDTPPLRSAMKVTLAPTIDGPSLVMATLGVARVTVCVTAGEVKPLLLMSPPYTAVIETLPMGKALVVQLTELMKTGCALQMGVLPAKKAMLPTGDTLPNKVAVKVTPTLTVDEPLPVTNRNGLALMTLCKTAAEVAVA